MATGFCLSIRQARHLINLPQGQLEGVSYQHCMDKIGHDLTTDYIFYIPNWNQEENKQKQKKTRKDMSTVLELLMLGFSFLYSLQLSLKL